LRVLERDKIIEAKEKLDVVKEDPEDNKFLECALKCGADYIISGDKHLIKIKEYVNIPIIRTSEILEIIRRKETNHDQANQTTANRKS